MAAVGLHALLFLSLHALAPSLDPLSSLISDYARTGYGAVAVAAFLAFGTIWGALAIAVRGTDRRVVAGRVLLALAPLAIFVAALFPETADPRTGSGLARIQNLLARPGLFLGILLVSWGLRRQRGWEELSRRLLGLAIGATALLVLTIGLLIEAGLGGLGQRVTFLLLYLWVWSLARHLLRTSKHLGNVEPTDGS